MFGWIGMGGFRSKRGARAHSDTENLRKGFDVRNIATIVTFQCIPAGLACQTVPQHHVRGSFLCRSVGEAGKGRRASHSYNNVRWRGKAGRVLSVSGGAGTGSASNPSSGTPSIIILSWEAKSIDRASS